MMFFIARLHLNDTVIKDYTARNEYGDIVKNPVYMKSDGNGGITVSKATIALLVILFTIIGAVFTTAMQYGQFKSDIAGVQDDLAEMRPVVSENHDAVAQIPIELDNIKSDISEIKSDIKDVLSAIYGG